MMKSIRSNTGRNSTKLYVEFTIDSLPSNSSVIIGLDDGSYNYVYSYDRGVGENERYPNSIGYKSTGIIHNRVNGSGTVSVPSIVQGDVIGLLVDLDNQEITFHKNNGFIATINIPSITYYLVVSLEEGTKITANMDGSTPFTYSIPSGYTSWDSGPTP